MFSRGKGFLATVKCQKCFHLGCFADSVSVLICVIVYIHWAFILALFLLGVLFAAKVYVPTRNLLFSSCSIVKYWREELGGKPDPDDPYDLGLPVQIFEERA